MTERTPEEWGRAAVALPGWTWMPGMLAQGPMGAWRTGELGALGGSWPDPDDPATEGCLLAVDPGLARIGLVVYDTEARRVVRAWAPARTTLQVVRDAVGVAALGGMHLAVELPRFYGKTRRLPGGRVVGVADRRLGYDEFGAEVASLGSTLVQVGRITEMATAAGMPLDHIHHVDRTSIAKHFRVKAKDGDAAVNAAVRRHLCGTDDMRKAKGTRMFPGPCYGVGGDAWAALAVAIVCAETRL